MLVVDKTVISTDVVEEKFICDLLKCKGACCVEGDLGAPLELDELPEIEQAVEAVKPYLSKEAVEAIESEGAYILDEEGDYSTTTINGAECAFAFYDENKILKCGLEQAWKDGKSEFRKPISCHLYPIRIKNLGEYDALNYDRWQICSPACDLGEKQGVSVFKFLKEPLIRKYGEDWYKKVEQAIQEEGSS